MSLIVFLPKNEKTAERANILRQHPAVITSSNDTMGQAHVCRIVNGIRTFYAQVDARGLQRSML
eukprot:14620955-Heterocapsa_arctica.AAC.1